MDWQPIETAPRDGTRILVGGYSPNRDEHYVYLAWWAIPHEAALPRQGYWRYDGDKACLDASIHSHGAAYWMPLPEPPSGPQADQA
jgi:hypothetical protein